MSKTVALLILLFMSLGFVIYWTKKLFEGYRPLFKRRVTSIVDNKVKAWTSFNKQFEVIEWEGNFEQYKVKFSSWLTYDNLIFSKNDYILEIKYNKKDEYKNYYEYLPDTVCLNSKHFNQTSLKCDKESVLMENELKEFFEHGKPIDFDRYNTKETLEVLIFGYFSYKRFINFLKKHFPDFIYKCRNYSGEPTAKIMDIFKSSNLSVEELEIEINKAVSSEDYEKAALLRDKIKSLQS